MALPNELLRVREDEVAVATLPQLELKGNAVDVLAIATALGSATRERRLLLLDQSRLKTDDDLSNLLLSPKGWLCTAEHKSCQNAC